MNMTGRCPTYSAFDGLSLHLKIKTNNFSFKSIGKCVMYVFKIINNNNNNNNKIIIILTVIMKY